MYCAGLMLPKMIQGFKFRIIDMDNVGGDSIIELNAPEDYYKIAILLRDNERFAIESVWSRTFDEPAAAISAQRLHNIAGDLHRHGRPHRPGPQPGRLPRTRGGPLPLRQGSLRRR